MINYEKIYINKRLIAYIIRKNTKIGQGLKFFSSPSDPFQLALHNYTAKKETNIHHNKIKNKLILINKNKFIYIIRGSAKVFLMTTPRIVKKTITIKKEECIVIKDIFHRVLFSKNSKAIEIKQGPYEK